MNWFLCILKNICSCCKKNNRACDDIDVSNVQLASSSSEDDVVNDAFIDLPSIDKALNEYEAMISKYLIVTQQAKHDDINVIYESAKIFNNLQEKKEDLNSIQDTMQPEQIDRYISLNNTLAGAKIFLK